MLFQSFSPPELLLKSSTFRLKLQPACCFSMPSGTFSRNTDEQEPVKTRKKKIKRIFMTVMLKNN